MAGGHAEGSGGHFVADDTAETSAKSQVCDENFERGETSEVSGRLRRPSTCRRGRSGAVPVGGAKRRRSAVGVGWGWGCQLHFGVNRAY